jgi:DnaK suppressor protein
MDHLTRAQIEELRESLRAERATVMSRGVTLADDAPDPGDRQDLAKEEARLRAELTVSQHARARLAEIDAALLRIDQGIYGICEETGDPIPFARLKARPTTRYTVEALELLEEERERTRRTADDDEDEAY